MKKLLLGALALSLASLSIANAQSTKKENEVITAPNNQPVPVSNLQIKLPSGTIQSLQSSVGSNVLITGGSISGVQLNAMTPGGASGALPGNVHANGSMVSLAQFGGYSDALQGAVNIAATGSDVTIGSQSFLNVNLQVLSTTQAILSPAWVLPYIKGLPTNNMFYDAPTAGTAGAAAHGQITSLDNVTGLIVGSPSTSFLIGFNGPVTINMYQGGQPRQATAAGAFYGVSTFANTTNAITGLVEGTTITLPVAYLPAIGTNGNSIQGLQVCVENGANAHGAWCGKVTTDPTAPDGKTMGVTGLPGYPRAMTLPASAAQPTKIAWAPMLFRPDDATACAGSGRSIEIPNAGTSTMNIGGAATAPTTAPVANYEGQIATRQDAFGITLVTAVGTTLNRNWTGTIGGADEYIVVGCDDYPALKKAAETVYKQTNTLESPVRIYLPADTFIAGVATDQANSMNYITTSMLCGDGTAYWGYTQNVFWHGATACEAPKLAKSFPDTKDVAPIHTKALSALSAGSTATVVFIGNSPMLPGVNNANFISGREERFCSAFQRAYPDLTVNCVDRSIGAQQMAAMDPQGFSNGRPNAQGPYPDWYSPANTIMSYVSALNPTVIVMGYADQESTNIEASAFLAVQQYTQTAPWLTATGGSTYPDLIAVPWPWQPTGPYSQQGTSGHAASMIRSMAKACVTRLNGGGCWGLIDESRQLNIVVDGYDPETVPMRHLTAGPTFAGNNLTVYPWVNLPLSSAASINNQFVWTNASASGAGLLTAMGGEFDYTISGNANSTANQQVVTVKSTAIANTGQAVITVGTDAYRLQVGYAVIPTVAGIPAADTITSINAGAGTITLTSNLTGSVASGTTINFVPPGPAVGYPGGILRLGNNSGSLFYAYDFVYYPVPVANCSGTSGAATFTCATAQIGNWHRWMQVAIPTAGVSQCPAPGSAANCFIGTISNVTYSNAGVATVTMLGGATAATGVTNVTPASITTTFTNQAPTVYRRSIPVTTTSVSTENLGNVNNTSTSYCSLSAGVSITTEFTVEYRGSRVGASYCSQSNPGDLIFMPSRFVERFDSPFQYTMDSPTHGSVVYRGQGPAYMTAAGVGVARTGLQGFEAQPYRPMYPSTARLSPDIYGTCATYQYGDPLWSPTGGGCAGHYGQNGASLIDDPILSAIRIR